MFIHVNNLLSVIPIFIILLSSLSIIPLSSGTSQNGIYTIDNGYFKVSVQIADVPDGVLGTYTVATSTKHPFPNNDVLFGGAEENPWSSSLSIGFPQVKRMFSTGPTAPSGFKLTFLRFVNYTVTTGNNHVAIKWALPVNVDLVNELFIHGSTLNDSIVEQRITIINHKNTPVEVWLMPMWDIKIDGEDGSVIRLWDRNGPITDWITHPTYISNTANIAFWEATNNKSNPLFYIWGSISLPSGVTTPTGLIFDGWRTLIEHAWNYTINTMPNMEGNDTAIAYLFVDTIPANSQKSYRQFIMAVTGTGNRPPQIASSTIPLNGTISGGSSPTTTTISTTSTHTTTITTTYGTQTRTSTTTPKTPGQNNTCNPSTITVSKIEVLGFTVTYKILLIILLGILLLLVLLITVSIAYIRKK